MGSIPREHTYWQKCIAWMHCKLLWIKAYAKCITVIKSSLVQAWISLTLSTCLSTDFLYSSPRSNPIQSRDVADCRCWQPHLLLNHAQLVKHFKWVKPVIFLLHAHTLKVTVNHLWEPDVGGLLSDQVREFETGWNNVKIIVHIILKCCFLNSIF